jgi:bifunctional ADP-heptose synthase (sugar kinase/adenylyltransferase)
MFGEGAEHGTRGRARYPTNKMDVVKYKSPIHYSGTSPKSGLMDLTRFRALTKRYRQLRVAVAGDFCLDRYLEIDPARKEISIETGLPVHNVVRVRSQPGGAGTILNNLAALGVAEIFPVGFAGEDGEGFELQRALAALPGVRTEAFYLTSGRRTFTYAKPLLISPNRPPRELNRLDSKNWTQTPVRLQRRLADAVLALARRVDAIIVMDQVDVPETGVVSRRLLRAIGAIKKERPDLLILADSRRSLRGYPPVSLKMNRAELSRLAGKSCLVPLREVGPTAAALARKKKNYCFVTLAEKGMVGAGPEGQVERLDALPVRGEIDVVGAGDCVTANLAAALAAGANLLARGRGQGGLGVGLKVGVHILGHDELAPHDQVVAGVGAEILVISLFRGSGQLERGFLAGFDQLGRGEDVRAFGTKARPSPSRSSGFILRGNPGRLSPACRAGRGPGCAA